MKIRDVIEQVDRLRRNTYEQKDKIRWLSQLDWRVKHQVIDTSKEGESMAFSGYNEDTDPDTELLVAEPYDEIYLRYLEAQIEYYDQQEDRYNNAIALFDEAWDRFAKWYIRTHTAKTYKLKF